MKKSELKEIIREMIQETLATATDIELKEKVEGPGYVIKAWSNPEKTHLVFDSAKKGIKYTDFEDVLTALKTTQLSGLGVYEITWVKSGTTKE